jgi:phosphonate metabolism protein PhnN/1,5-bisphosphokinase (PRPP-forming)
MSPLPFIPNSERLLVIVGASGAGKDTVLRAWRRQLGAKPVHFAQRVITRMPDGNEDHESVSGEGFRRLVEGAELATWWKANGLSYGIRWRELAAISHGESVVMNGSRAHLPALRTQAPALRAVEIGASDETLSHRLAARGREAEPAIRSRLQRRIPATVDVVVMNDGPIEGAVETLHTWWEARMRQS